MQKIHNEYHILSDQVIRLCIFSTKYPQIDILFPHSVYKEVMNLSWCYECEKELAYTMDFSLEIPKRLGLKSPRVYLWKYIPYVMMGGIAATWQRKNKNDYTNGKIIFTDGTSHDMYIPDAMCLR
jgi:predicted DNA-binding protein (UPF0278 family)